MLSRLLICTIAILLVCFVASAGDSHNRIPKMEEAKVLPVDNSVNQASAAPEISRSTQAVKVEKISVVAGTPMKIGTTDYGVSFNSGFSRVLTADRGGNLHFTFMERFGTLTAPNNNRAQAYMYYNGTTLTGPFYGVAKSVRASGFGGVDAFSDGPAAGYAVMVAHTGSTPGWAAIDGGPGSGSFTAVNIGTKTFDDPEVLCDNRRQTIWVSTTGSFDAPFTTGRGRYGVWKSVDFGSTYTEVDTNLLWQFAPSKGFVVGSLDVPLIVAPNGNLALVTTLRNTAATQTSLPPIGTGTADSCRRIGYFLSTNGGTSWTWNDIGISGTAIVRAPGDTLYPLFANFGQFSAAFDGNSKLHIVCNGYSYKPTKWSAAGTYYFTLFCTYYWNSITSKWTTISDKSFEQPMLNDTTCLWETTAYKYFGNSYGFCWPNLSCDTSSNRVFVSWSQPRLTSSKKAIDTTWRGYPHMDIVVTLSTNSGSTWTTPSVLSNTADGVFGYSDRNIATVGTGKYAHLAYLVDTIGALTAAATSTSQQVSWYYQKVDLSTITGVEGSSALPSSFSLMQNYPNPFNPSTNFRFTLPVASTVKLSVYNILGQEVATVLNSTALSAGEHSFTFDASNLSSGVYFYRLTADKFTATKKMMLMK